MMVLPTLQADCNQIYTSIAKNIPAVRLIELERVLYSLLRGICPGWKLWDEVFQFEAQACSEPAPASQLVCSSSWSWWWCSSVHASNLGWDATVPVTIEQQKRVLSMVGRRGMDCPPPPPPTETLAIYISTFLHFDLLFFTPPAPMLHCFVRARGARVLATMDACPPGGEGHIRSTCITSHAPTGRAHIGQTTPPDQISWDRWSWGLPVHALYASYT